MGRALSGDLRLYAGRILEGEASLDEVGAEIVRLIADVAGGAPTKSERLGHREFVLTYKNFVPIGPACLPLRTFL